MKKRRPRPTIHISIGLLKQQTNKSSTQTTHPTIIRSNRVTPIEFLEYNTVNEFHRNLKKNKKQKCSKRYLKAILLTFIILIIIVTIILLVLFIKPKENRVSNTVTMLRWNSTGVTIIGGLGSAQNQLNTPLSTIVDYANNLYVVDYGNNRVQRFTFGHTTGQTLAGNGSLGCSQYQFYLPSQMVSDSNYNLFIADTYCHRVQFWPSKSSNVTTVAGNGVSGNSSLQLFKPYGVTIHSITNTLYVADYENHRIMSYTSGNTNGTLELGGTGFGYSNTKLCYPVQLYFDLFSNSLLIANAGANNIVQWNIGANNWTLVAGNSSGIPGITSDRLSQATGAIFDPMGNLYVADRNNHRIQFFYNGQFNGTTIAGISGVNSSNMTTLNMPWSITFDNQLNLYVTDAYNHRIQKFFRL